MNIVFDATGAKDSELGLTSRTQVGEKAVVSAIGTGVFFTITHGRDAENKREVRILDTNGVVQAINIAGAGTFKVEYLTATTTKITNNLAGTFAGEIILFI